MKKIREQELNRLIFILFEFFSIISCFTCIIFVNVETKYFLTLLPLGFAIISLFFNKNYISIKENISILIIETLYFIRLSILPFLYSFNCNTQLFEGKGYVGSFINKSCLLMLYEFLIVQIIIYVHLYHQHSNKSKAPFLILKENITKFLIIGLASYIIIIYFFMPQYAESFKNIFNLSDINFTTSSVNTIYQIGTIGRIIKTLFSMSFQIFRVLFPAYVIRELYRKKTNSKLIGVTLIISCLLQFLFLTATFAEAIVSCLAIILYYLHLFPEKRKKVFIFIIICTLGIMMVYFSVRYFVKTGTSMYNKSNGPVLYMAQIINAYFTGVDNVAAIFNVEKVFKAEAFKAGLLGAIPFNSTLFGNRGNKLQYFYNKANSSYGQIPPTIGAGYYYFGIIFAPIISGLFVKLSLKYYDKSKKIEKSIKYIAEIFCSIVFALGTVMYSPSIALSWFLGWGIPMLILTSFTGER